MIYKGVFVWYNK